MARSADGDDTTKIEGVLVGVSGKAILLRVEAPGGEKEVWLPISQIEYDLSAARGKMTEVEMPVWLANEKGLV